MSSNALTEHAGYFRDQSKVDAYRRALSAIVRPGDTIVDLGSGTGLLGLLAAEAGASTVYMVDEGSILGVACEVAERNGLGDRLIPIRGHSADVAVPTPADVVVCDQIGGFVYDAGVLDFFHDARARLLRPGGTLIPSAFTLFAAPVIAPEVRDAIDVWSTRPAGFDTEPLHRLAVNNAWHVQPDDVEITATASSLFTFDSASLEPVKATAEFEFDRSAGVDGILGWFDAELAPDVHLTNSPEVADRMRRWCNFYPLAQPLHVESGDRLDVTIDLRPASSLMAWTVTWQRGTERLGRWRHSTVLGQFMSPEDLALAGTSPLQLTEQGAATAAALAEVNGKATATEIIGKVLIDHPDAFASEARARTVLAAQIAKWTRAQP